MVKHLLRHRDRVVFPRIGPCLFIGDVCLNAYEQNTEIRLKQTSLLVYLIECKILLGAHTIVGHAFVTR